jgi:hypothetical protein
VRRKPSAGADDLQRRVAAVLRFISFPGRRERPLFGLAVRKAAAFQDLPEHARNLILAGERTREASGRPHSCCHEERPGGVGPVETSSRPWNGAFDYGQELEGRIARFAHYLGLMHGRAHDEAHGPCFLIIEERRPRGTGEEDELAEEAEFSLELVSAAFEAFGGIAGTADFDEAMLAGLPAEGWRGDESQNRFVPFRFE